MNVMDVTLKEADMCLGVFLNKTKRMEILKQLLKLNVDCIDMGDFIVRESEHDHMNDILKVAKNIPILLNTRISKNGIDSAKNAGANWIGIYVKIDFYLWKAKLDAKSITNILKMIDSKVKYAKSLNLSVRFTLCDASRIESSLLLKIYEVAINAGVDRICYSDSSGCDNIWSISNNIYQIKQIFSDIDIEVHCYNDRGLALANVLSAIKAGANWVSSSINGIGARSGVVDTAQLLVNLHHEFGRQLPQVGQLKKTSNIVSGLTRQFLSYQHPIVGVNAFSYKKQSQRSHSLNSWIDPVLLGEKYKINDAGIPSENEKLLISPLIISAVELLYHRHGPGNRFVMIDNRFINDSRCYCIVRDVVKVENEQPHVDKHRHCVDSLFLFIGNDDNLNGLTVEVSLSEERFVVHSPTAVFIPAGISHSYRFIKGSGKFINFVLAGDYNSSLLDED